MQVDSAGVLKVQHLLHIARAAGGGGGGGGAGRGGGGYGADLSMGGSHNESVRTQCGPMGSRFQVYIEWSPVGPGWVAGVRERRVTIKRCRV